MTEAKNLTFNQVFLDRKITHTEANKLIKMSFASTEVDATVDQDWYGSLKEVLLTHEAESVYRPIAKLTYENEDDRRRLQTLVGSYPGSLGEYLAGLRAEGLADGVDLKIALPTVEFQAIYQDAENADVIHVLFAFEGRQRDFAVDTTQTLEEQSFYREDVRNPDLFVDVMTAMQEMYDVSGWDSGMRIELVPEEVELFIRLQDYTDVLPGSFAMNTSIMTDDDLSVFGLDERDAPFLKPLATDFSMPVDTDQSLSDAELQSFLSEVSTIVGPETLSVLAAEGWSVVFFDGEALDAKYQVYGPVHSDQSLEGVTSYNRQKMTIDTHANRSMMIWSAVHEIAHAINLVIQKQAQAMPLSYDMSRADGRTETAADYAFTGAQVAGFVTETEYRNDPSEGPLFTGTDYARTDSQEWFAESFTLYLLERAGRFDVIAQNPGVEAVVRQYGLFVVDPYTYLVLAKIDSTILGKDLYPEAYEKLLAQGITDELYAQAQGFLEQMYYAYATDAILYEKEANPDQISPTLTKWLKKWAAVSLEKPVTLTPETDLTAEFEQTVRDDFANLKDPLVQAQYLPDAYGVIAKQVRITESADYQAVAIAVALERAQSMGEKIIILIDYGIYTEELFEELLTHLTILSPGEVADLLNPTLLAAEPLPLDTSWRNGFGYWDTTQKISPIGSSLVNEAHKEYVRRMQLAAE